MSSGELVLQKREATTLEERLIKINFQGAAITGLCELMEVIQEINDADPCPNCYQPPNHISTEIATWSIRLGIEALAKNIEYESKRVNDMVREGRVASQVSASDVVKISGTEQEVA